MILIIIFNVNVQDTLKNKGYTTYILQKKLKIPGAVVDKLKNNDPMVFNMVIINKICALLDCQPGDILEYVPDDSTAGLAAQAAEVSKKAEI